MGMNTEIDQKWIVRPLKLEDLNDISDISKDIWNGNDYLPKIFHEWITAPGLFLGIEDREKHHIIATGKYSYLHDGTGWLEGLRVHSAYRNLGLSKILLQFLFTRALEDLRQNKIQRIANCTHLSNEISIHLSQQNGFVIEQRFLVVQAEHQANYTPIKIQSWQPTYEEIQAQPYFRNTHGLICQSFLVQSIHPRWFEEISGRAVFAIVNGCPGWVDLALEPYVQMLNPTPEAVVAWLQYGSKVLGSRVCMTFLYPETGLIEALKKLPVHTWMDYEPDCLYLVYQPDHSVKR